MDELTISVFISRFKTSNLEHIIEVRLYDEIDFVCPHFHSSTDPTAYEYYIIHQVRSGTFMPHLSRELVFGLHMYTL